MIIDIIFLLSVIVGFRIGYRQGLIRSVFSLLALFFGIMFALKYSYQFAYFLYETFSITGQWVPFVSFLLLFLIVVALVNYISHLLSKIIQALYLGFINKLAGGIVWCVILTLIFSTLLWFANQMGLVTEGLQSNSRTYNFLISAAPIVIDFFSRMVPFFEGLFDAFDHLFKEMQSNHTITA